MKFYPQTMQRLIEEFGKMPGIGQKTAERLAHYVLRLSTEQAMGLARAIRDLKKNIRNCSICFNISEAETCEICRDPKRDRGVLCVVEQTAELWNLEKTGQYDGLYHVLLGHISPLDSVGPENLTIDRLVERVKKGEFREVILATNFSLEGDATAVYIQKQLSASGERGLKVTRLARGIPQGSYLEYMNSAVLADAMQGRRAMGPA